MVINERYTKGRQIMEATARVNGVDLDQMMETIDAIKLDADLGQCTFRAHNKWVDGTLNRTTIKGFYGMGQEDESRTESFELLADEPPALAGENRGANPVEYLLTGLAGCLTTGLVAHAAARGIVIEEAECRLEGDIDLRGFLGISPEVKKGYRDIRVSFRVKSDASSEELMELCQFSPVFDTITSPTPVSVDIELV
jgi:uncharacterized OsmC-like protein